MRRVAELHGVPSFVDDTVRGCSVLAVNGVFYDLRDPDHERAKSEAIAEQSEELELARAELRAYRRALGNMTPEAQLRAALEVSGCRDEEAGRVIEAWRKIQEL